MTLCNVAVFTIRHFILSRVEIILSRAIGSSKTIEFVAESNSMKRTRTATRIQQENKIEKNKDNEDTVITKSKRRFDFHLLFIIVAKYIQVYQLVYSNRVEINKINISKNNTSTLFSYFFLQQKYRNCLIPV